MLIKRKLIENTGRRDRGVKVGNLHMCRETKMPAILCECGFMDNKEEAELLKSEDYRLKCAKAIAYRILEYLNININENIKPEKPVESTNNNIESESDEPVRRYQNGSTPEPVYADTNCTNKIRSLNLRETCDCFGIFNNKVMVRYKVDGNNNYKIGFCNWLGGVK